MSVFQTPPSEMLTRMDEKLHLFSQVIVDLQTSSSEVRNANHVSSLQSRMFSSHPYVHKGYYDSKRAGVLYVKDKFTGESIRKDSSIMLSTGEFTSPINRKFITEGSLSLSFIADLQETNDYWIKCPKLGVYFPLVKNNIVTYVTDKDFIKSLNHLYRKFCESTSTNTLTGENYSAFKEFFEASYRSRSSLTSKYKNKHFVDPTTEIPNNFLELPEGTDFIDKIYLKITNNTGYNVSQLLNKLNGSDDTVKPYYLIGYDDYRGLNVPNNNTQSLGLIGNTDRVSTRFEDIEDNPITYNFPVPLRMYSHPLSRPSTNTRGRTRNNEGALLNYSFDVMQAKDSFLMTDGEKARFIKSGLELDGEMLKYRARKSAIEEKMHRATTMKEERRLNNLRNSMREPTKYRDNAPPFLGVEVELVPRRKAYNIGDFSNLIRDIADSPFGDYCVMKSDSSIGVYGFEIVTVPATLNYHKKMFSEVFFNDPHNFHQRSMSTERCGIHVHIAKQTFTRMQLGKFISFINRPQNKEFIDAMAGRVPNQYCSRATLTPTNAKGIDVSAKIARNINLNGSDGTLGRGALHLGKSKTVEIRIFKSTNSENNLIRKLEFCESAVRFCKTGNYSLQEMDVHNFINFILDKENKQQYPYLVRWLASKNYIDHDRRPIKGKRRLVHVYHTNKVPNPKQKNTA